MINRLKQTRAITLIALIITIIVLLILAGVVINMTVGNNGIIAKAQSAANAYQNAQEKEEIELAKAEDMIYGNRNISEEDLVKLIQREVKKINEEKNTVMQLVPAGTVISYIAGSNPPAGYLKCDGETYNISEYPNLAKAILDGFGKYDYWGGNGTTTFAVPDLRGEFLRGTDTATRNTGTGDDVGKHQDGTIFPVYRLGHDSTYNSFYINGYFSDGSKADENLNIMQEDKIISRSSYSVDVTKSNYSTYRWTADNAKEITSRPTNTSVLYCIKY